jgi:glycine cleavage system T protein (aminomethyltransferase)
VVFEPKPSDEDRVVAVHGIGPGGVRVTRSDQDARQGGGRRGAVLRLEGLGQTIENVRLGREARRFAVARRCVRPAGLSLLIPSFGMIRDARTMMGVHDGRPPCANFPIPMSVPAAQVPLRRTPLYDVHRELGAKLIDFGGWEMPVQYSGILEEHRAVRERVGLFDVSHMGEFDVTGPDALACLQRLTPNDVAALADGRIHYSAFLTEKGTFVDDLLVYRRGPDSYMLVVNAGNTPKDFAWATSHADPDAKFTDRSSDYALIAVQGPKAAALLSRVAQPDPNALPYYGFGLTVVAGAPTLVSRTGYTGEDGFEVYCRPDDAARLFRKLLEEGKAEAAVPCGLGARDTLRLEAKMALYGNDIDDTVTAYEAELAWIVKPAKGDFIGRQALLDQKAAGVPRRLVGFEMVDRGIARHGYPASTSSGPGLVTSGTHSPTLGKPIGLALLPSGATAVGTEFSVDIRGRSAAARVVPTPFYKRRA